MTAPEAVPIGAEPVRVAYPGAERPARSYRVDVQTGLTVTIGAVLTLFVLMQLTGRVDWAAVFARPAGPGSARAGQG